MQTEKHGHKISCNNDRHTYDSCHRVLKWLDRHRSESPRCHKEAENSREHSLGLSLLADSDDNRLLYDQYDPFSYENSPLQQERNNFGERKRRNMSIKGSQNS